MNGYQVPSEILKFLNLREANYTPGRAARILEFYQTHGMLPATFGPTTPRADYAAYLNGEMGGGSTTT